MASLRILLSFLLFYGILYIPTHYDALYYLPETHTALFIFGDSIFDAGNNNYINTTNDLRANFWPYGETTLKIATGRASDGLLIPDFIAEYTKLPFIPPYLQPGFHDISNGANFASAGAGALVETNQGFVIDLNRQLEYFKNVERLLKQKLGDAKAKRLLSRAIYLFSIGNNDYFAPFIFNSTMLQFYSEQVYVDMVIGNLTTVIREIYEKGGRKFGFLNLPPLGCLPITRAAMPVTRNGCAKEITELVKLHNRKLTEFLPKLELQLQGFKYSDIDFYTSLSNRLKDPSKYDFKEGNAGCCGSGPYRGLTSCGGQRSEKEYEVCDNVGDYVIFDAAHPTEKAYRQIAELMWNGDDKIARPYNLKQLHQLQTIIHHDI